MQSEPGKQKCSWSRWEPLRNKNHPDVLNTFYFKHAPLSPQLALQEAPRWKARVTKTICLKDNLREINQSEQEAAPEVWDQSRGHTQLQLSPTAPSRFPPSLKKSQAHHSMWPLKNPNVCTALELMAGTQTRVQLWMETSQSNSLTFCEASCKSYDNKHFAFWLQIHLKGRKGNVRKLVFLR